MLTKRNQTKPKETKKNRVERVERVRVRERERVRGRVRVEAFATKEKFRLAFEEVSPCGQ